MANALSELPELLNWLETTIEPIQGQPWQITLNSSGAVVDAKATLVESKSTDDRGATMIISRVIQTRFRLGRSPQRRTVFSTE